jgi:hypothetical protein
MEKNCRFPGPGCDSETEKNCPYSPKSSEINVTPYLITIKDKHEQKEVPQMTKEQNIRITTYGNSNLDYGKYNITPKTVTLIDGTTIEVTAICTGCWGKTKCYISTEKTHIPFEDTTNNSWQGNKNESPVANVLFVKCPPKFILTAKAA